MAVAASGGGDSTALLHCAARIALQLGLHVHALHVHHGLLAAADSWVRQLRRQVSRWQCQGLPVSLHVHRLAGAPSRGESVEAWARRERYATLGAMARESGCSLVLLAQHRRDQAETFLLQALRGGGAAGLAAMPAAIEREGLWWCRPWLRQPREAIEAYLRQHGLGAVQDPSNTDPRYARARLRGAPWQSLVTAFADAEAALAAAAARARSESAALREWADQELRALGGGEALPIAPWLALSPARRESTLRAWLQRQGSAAAQTLVTRLMRELPAASQADWPDDAQHRLVLHRGGLRRERRLPHAATRDAAPQGAEVGRDLSRLGDHRVAHWHGAIRVELANDAGIDPASLCRAILRVRQGGERFQLALNRPARSLKKQFQALGITPAQRHGPLVFVGNELVFVPGLGIDARWRAAHRPRDSSRGVTLVWVPDGALAPEPDPAPSTQG